MAKIDKKDVEAIRKHAETVVKPREEEERKTQAEELMEIIETEKELIKLFSPKRLSLQVPYGGKVLKFKIRPLTSTEDIETVGLDYNVYMDLSEIEKQVIHKKSRGESLTPEEQSIYDDKEKELTETKTLDQAHHILATFLTPPTFNQYKDEKKRYNKKMEFWRAFPLDLKLFLFNEIIERLGLNPEIDFKLFQTN